MSAVAAVEWLSTREPSKTITYRTDHPQLVGADVVQEDATFAEIAASPLRPRGKRAAIQAVRTIRSRCEADECVIPTDDDGLTIEFSSRTTEREMVIAIPDDGTVMYFVARGPEGFRVAGIVRADLGQLGRWLARGEVPFPRESVEIG